MLNIEKLELIQKEVSQLKRDCQKGELIFKGEGREKEIISKRETLDKYGIEYKVNGFKNFEIITIVEETIDVNGVYPTI